MIVFQAHNFLFYKDLGSMSVTWVGSEQNFLSYEN